MLQDGARISIFIFSYLSSLQRYSLACLTQRLRENITFSGNLPPFILKVVGLCFENSCPWINTKNLINAYTIWHLWGFKSPWLANRKLGSDLNVQRMKNTCALSYTLQLNQTKRKEVVHNVHKHNLNKVTAHITLMSLYRSKHILRIRNAFLSSSWLFLHS